jgi:hypothetical protein
MGWLFPYECTTKQSLVDHVMRGWTDGAVVHATKRTKDGMWILCTPKGYDHKIIGLYLMEKAQGLWGYKDLDESSHPYYYDVPLDWLDKAPVANQAWRDGVHANLKKKIEMKEAAKKIVAGKTYKVNGSWKYGGKTLTQLYVTSTKPRRGVVDGWNVRISKKLMASLEEMP